MSKKMKFLIIFIVILVIIGLIFGISTIVRFVKLQSIWSRLEENIEKNNFYLETTIINNGSSKKTQTFYKDGIGKFVSQDGTYIWFDGEKAYSIDEENKKAVLLDTSNVIGVISKDSFASLYPGYTNNLFERLIFAGNLSNKMKKHHYNGEKCIVIEIHEENYTKTFWIKETFKELIQAKIEFTNGDVYEYKYDMKFHTTKLKDIELPDFSEYTMIKENNTITENYNEIKEQNVIVENIIENPQTIPIG